MPYIRRDKSYLVPMTLSLGVSAWCEQNKQEIKPYFISDVMMNLAKMKLRPTALLTTFETQFETNLNVFSDEVRTEEINEIQEKLKLLKTFAIIRYKNQNVLDFLVDQLSLIESTLSTKVWLR